MRKVFASAPVITQYFGVNKAQYARFDLEGHDGLDCVPSDMEDKRIYAICSGEIIAAYESSSYGLTLKIYDKYTHTYFRYAHLSQMLVKKGEFIRERSLIGIMGSTGNATGPHLHLHQVPVNDETMEKKHPANGYKGRMDPLPFLESDDII
jgi:murein DD-endopeptidase MepM/ murein hydrolase activator NlpD